VGVESHVHCASCYREIELYKPGNLGEPIEAEVQTGEQIVLAPGPTGPETRTRRVPLCDSCVQRIKVGQTLIVPRVTAVKQDNGKGQR
jgi:hypothetical protein